MGLSCPTDDIRRDVFSVIDAWNCDVATRITLFGGAGRTVRATSVSHPPASLCCALRPWPGPTGIDDVKHGSRAPWVISVRESGMDDVLWVQGGHYLEATTGNVFALCDGVLITPPLDGRILPGVTREILLELAQEAGVPVLEASLPITAPMTELYLSSSLKILAPVVALNGKPAPGEGPVGQHLREAFWSLVLPKNVPE